MSHSQDAFPDHFSGLSREYARHRPTYPAALIDALVRLVPARECAWDCATGNGQAARLLAEHFGRVVATDASAEQLAHALRHPRIEYRRAHAEDSGLATGSVELVTVAAAAHWFDHARFHAEVERVLVPGGVLAVWTYDPVLVDPCVDDVTRWYQRERVGRHWPPQRAYVDARYETLPFPYSPVDLGSFRIDARLTRADVVGYLATWSATARCRATEGVDPIPELERRLTEVWPDAHEPRAGHWPLYLRVGRKPARS